MKWLESPSSYSFLDLIQMTYPMQREICLLSVRVNQVSESLYLRSNAFCYRYYSRSNFSRYADRTELQVQGEEIDSNTKSE